jgi:NosR/NirI family transcriptional regulator, nitrous oxide reductase regulator
MRLIWPLLFLLCHASALWAQAMDRATMEPLIVPPYALGEAVNDKGVWTLLNSGGAEAGFVFETEILAPLPGFSGAPINMLVMLDLDGRFIDVKLIEQNEPIFVSGLGEAPFRKFLEQYRGQSINTPMVVGSPYGAEGAGSGIAYLDGVLKATASVRIAHESIMAATREVAREKMKGVNAAPPAQPKLDYDEPLDWQALVDQGIARNIRVSNAEQDAAFAGTRWAHDDPEPEADPASDFLNLWLVDIGPPAIARAVLDAESLRDLARFMGVSPFDEPFLVIDTGRHGLVSKDFVRNTAPDLLTAVQDDLPVSLRDADLLFTTAKGVPQGVALILRADRRLGFDPAREWVLKIKAIRAHGMFQPELGSVDFALTQATPERFFERPGAVEVLSPWREAIRNRMGDLILLALALPALFLALGPGMNRLAGLRIYTPIRLGILAFMTGFVGWWGQGQLSIVTPLATLRTALQGGSFGYLLYDPFSLLLWAATGVGFVLWGRGLFCGWLCPFGALQEFAHHLGRALRLPKWEPSVLWDQRLKLVKYLLLAGLIATAIFVPDEIDTVVEIEPFKTAITTFFIRDWPYVAYAVAWLVLGMFSFKGFCRYVCPLGALMAIGGLLRGRDWIARRKECGGPCQLCRVRCAYGAIKPGGEIQYSECFQCLDCVTIHDDPKQCVPLVLAAKGRSLGERSAA